MIGFFLRDAGREQRLGRDWAENVLVIQQFRRAAEIAVPGDGLDATHDHGVTVTTLHPSCCRICLTCSCIDAGEREVEIVLHNEIRQGRWGVSDEMLAAVRTNELRLGGVPLSFAATAVADMTF